MVTTTVRLHIWRRRGSGSRWGALLVDALVSTRMLAMMSAVVVAVATVVTMSTAHVRLTMVAAMSVEAFILKVMIVIPIGPLRVAGVARSQ